MGNGSLLVSAEIYPVSSFDSSVELSVSLHEVRIEDLVFRRVQLCE